MPRERIVESFILKRTDYSEADQIVTLFSKEEGKIRVLAKAAKLPTSKLQPMLQPLFETRVSLSGSKDGTGLAKVIGVQLIKAYGGILESEQKLSAWYVVAELLIRALPDSQPNEKLYAELQDYARFLHETDLSSEQIKQSVAQFQIKAMISLGLGIRTLESAQQNIWFSLDRGGFVAETGVDAIPIQPQAMSSFKTLAQESYAAGAEVLATELASMPKLINRFVAYQLEREIRSHQLFETNLI